MNSHDDELTEADRSDAELLKSFQDGKREAADEIYSRYAHRILRLAQKRTQPLSSRVDAEDVVQSVFRTFFRRASTGCYALPDGDELWKLFLIISLNKIRKKVEYHKAAKRDLSITQTIGTYDPMGPSTPSDWLQLTINELVGELPHEHQGVVRDRIQGFEVSEIAQRNHLSLRTTERVLQAFRKRLQRELESCE